MSENKNKYLFNICDALLIMRFVKNILYKFNNHVKYTNYKKKYCYFEIEVIRFNNGKLDLIVQIDN